MKCIRSVSLELKPGANAEFTKILNSDVLPVMRKQAGFEHPISMVNGSSAVGLSMWKDEASAETFQKTVYPAVLKSLSPVINGTPRITHDELAASTLTA